MQKTQIIAVKQTISENLPAIEHAGKYDIWFYVEPFLSSKESFLPSKESSNNHFFQKRFLWC